MGFAATTETALTHFRSASLGSAGGISQLGTPQRKWRNVRMCWLSREG